MRCELEARFRGLRYESRHKKVDPDEKYFSSAETTARAEVKGHTVRTTSIPGKPHPKQGVFVIGLRLQYCCREVGGIGRRCRTQTLRPLVRLARSVVVTGAVLTLFRPFLESAIGPTEGQSRRRSFSPCSIRLDCLRRLLKYHASKCVLFCWIGSTCIPIDRKAPGLNQGWVSWQTSAVNMKEYRHFPAPHCPVGRTLGLLVCRFPWGVKNASSHNENII